MSEISDTFSYHTRGANEEMNVRTNKIMKN